MLSPNSGSEDPGLAIHLLARPSALLSWSQGIWCSLHLEEYTVDCREEVTGSSLLASASLCLQWDAPAFKADTFLVFCTGTRVHILKTADRHTA